MCFGSKNLYQITNLPQTTFQEDIPIEVGPDQTMWEKSRWLFHSRCFFHVTAKSPRGCVRVDGGMDEEQLVPK